MSDYLIAVIVGCVEGLTEFIPVSSTAHMIIVGHMLGFTGDFAALFDVFIQLGQSCPSSLSTKTGSDAF